MKFHFAHRRTLLCFKPLINMLTCRRGFLVRNSTVFAPLPRGSTQTGGTHFKPFNDRDENDLVKVITSRPRHVLRHVRQQVWRSRKKELQFRNTVTQLMIVLQDHLRKQLLDPQHASVILEGVLEDCVRFGQHAMAHLLFRAFLRFRKFGCVISIDALRNLFDSYKGTDNIEMMRQLANELKDQDGMRAFCIAAYLFAGMLEEAEALKSAIPSKEIQAQDLIAMAEGYDKIRRRDMIVKHIITPLETFELGADESMEVFTVIFKVFARHNDEVNFALAFEKARSLRVPFNAVGFATVLRMQLRHASSLEEVAKIETELRALGYEPDLTGNSVIISAYARMMHFGDKTSEEVMLSKVDTLLASIESRAKDVNEGGDLEVTTQHVRAVLRGYGAAGRPEMMKTAFERLKKISEDEGDATAVQDQETEKHTRDADIKTGGNSKYRNKYSISADTRVYNELLKWYSLMGNVKDVLTTKAEMAENNIQPNAHTYTWTFRALGKYYPRQVEKFYLEMQKQAVIPDISLYTTLIACFGDCKNFEKVEEIVSSVRKRETAGTVPITYQTYAVLLRIYSHDLSKVQEFYDEAIEKGVGNHSHVVTAYFSAVAAHKDGAERLNDALKKLDAIGNEKENSIGWTVDVCNVLLNMYAKKGERESLAALVDRMARDGIEYNEVTFGTLMTAYGRWRDATKVAELVDILKGKEGQVSASFYSILAAAYSKLGDAEGIDDAWEDLISSRLFPDTETYNTFLSLYGRNHNVPKMQVVMDNMLRQVPPNPLTATTVVDVLGKSGRLAEMENLISDMRQSPDTAPTSVTYHQAMNAYAKNGDVIKMERMRDEMVANGFSENAVTFNILAEGYGRAKRFEQLADLCTRREQKNIPMDELGYCVLIAAYGRARNSRELVKIAAKILAVANPRASDVITSRIKWSFVDAFCRCQDVTSMQYWVDRLRVSEVSDETGTAVETNTKQYYDGFRAMDLRNLVSYYCRVRQMQRAEEFMHAYEERLSAAQTHTPLVADGKKDKKNIKMSEKMKEQSFSMLQAMARGYATVGRYDKCVEMLHMMRDRGFVPDAATALTLSQQFLKAGLHEQAQQVVQWRRVHGGGLGETSMTSAVMSNSEPAVSTDSSHRYQKGVTEVVV